MGCQLVFSHQGKAFGPLVWLGLGMNNLAKNENCDYFEPILQLEFFFSFAPSFIHSPLLQDFPVSFV